MACGRRRGPPRRTTDRGRARRLPHDVPSCGAEAVAAAATARLGDEGAFVANNPDVALRQAAGDRDSWRSQPMRRPRARRRPTRGAVELAVRRRALARSIRSAHVAQRLGDDEHASHGEAARRGAERSTRARPARSLVLAQRGSAARWRLGRSRAVAVSFAEAGEISSALGAWEEIAGDVDATARAALCSALVNGGETGRCRAAAKVLQGSAGSWKLDRRRSRRRPTKPRGSGRRRRARRRAARNWAEGATDQDAHPRSRRAGARASSCPRRPYALDPGAAAAARGRRRAGRYCHLYAPRHPAVFRRPGLRDGSDRTSESLELFADDAPDEAERYDNLPNRRAAQLDSQRASASWRGGSWRRHAWRARSRFPDQCELFGLWQFAVGLRSNWTPSPRGVLGVRLSSLTAWPRLSSLAGSRRSPSSARVSLLRG